ncbi:hypothetical protein CLF_111520 [Clonorchis sinensis]|uniref:Uncharacterized protein n=1 Tax=Clonorchis sinensis TaxID=79923 RepID=G7YLQ0_CLOSI|nr:hypothetical protein CLF_111520 [Clonorchis sinensis]
MINRRLAIVNPLTPSKTSQLTPGSLSPDGKTQTAHSSPEHITSFVKAANWNSLPSPVTERTTIQAPCSICLRNAACSKLDVVHPSDYQLNSNTSRLPPYFCPSHAASGLLSGSTRNTGNNVQSVCPWSCAVTPPKIDKAVAGRRSCSYTLILEDSTRRPHRSSDVYDTGICYSTWLLNINRPSVCPLVERRCSGITAALKPNRYVTVTRDDSTIDQNSAEQFWVEYYVVPHVCAKDEFGFTWNTRITDSLRTVSVDDDALRIFVLRSETDPLRRKLERRQMPRMYRRYGGYT